jgi:hypothetical protein
MTRLVIASWIRLVYVDIALWIGGFSGVHEMVSESRARPRQSSPVPSPAVLSRAMDLACVFYVKRVLCLQRSAAITYLLRRYGWHAELVIGVQMLPFESHAWVEIEKVPVNDKSYVNELYTELKRC